MNISVAPRVVVVKPRLSNPHDRISRLDLAQAARFVRWLTGQDCRLIDKPDAPGRQSRNGGHPDGVFGGASGERYIVEVERLLTPELRQLENYAIEKIARPFEGRVSGTFTLELRIDRLMSARLPVDLTIDTVKEIEAAISSGHLQESQALATGFPLRRVLKDGNRIVPWIVAEELPYDLRDDNPAASRLRVKFREQVEKANRKFEGWQGNRIVLLDIGQSGLDIEFHATRVRDGQGILLTWAETLCRKLKNIDFIFLEPGVRVWAPTSNPDKMHQIYAGTRWVDQPRGFYHHLWCRPGHPPVGRFAM